MNNSNYKIITSEHNKTIRDYNYETNRVVWPEFMLHDPLAKYFENLFTDYGLTKYQFALVETESDNIVVSGNSIPLLWEDEIINLPDEGWDWAINKGIEDYQNGRRPNYLCALQIVASPEYKGKGLSRLAVEAMKNIGKENGLIGLIAPVRPNKKCGFPLEPFDEYIKRKNNEGLPYDPWMRVHARMGAEIIKPCHKAMTITGTVAEWEEWTKMKFQNSGKYTIPGALVQIDIDLENDLGAYIEPNVWMHHK